MAIHIKNLIPTLLPKQNNWKLTLLNNWNDIVGDLQTHVQLVSIQYDNTLILGVDNPSWIQELYLLSNILIDKINKKLDKPYVKQLRFRYMPKRKQRKPKQAIRQKKHTITTALTKKEESALKKIEDPELINALKQFLIRCHEER